jgi:hypothetical protein
MAIPRIRIAFLLYSFSQNDAEDNTGIVSYLLEYLKCQVKDISPYSHDSGKTIMQRM